MADTGTAALTERQRLELRKASLWNERSSWMPHWREISENQQPRAGRFVSTDRNKGQARYNTIYDNTALFAARTLAAGMMSGMTSPARPWFRLSLADADLRELGPVKAWLHRTGILLREIFARSNTYRALHSGYEELGLFGTWATVMLPDFKNVVHHYPLTIGEYAIGTDHRGVVDTIAREYEMTVGQMVNEWGADNVSSSVKNLYDRHSLDAWVKVVHIIEPNKQHDPARLDARAMRFSSSYFEPSNDRSSDKFLSRSGFKRFPALAPRWVLSGQDIYGTSPGMEVLGDVKQLQFEQLRKAQGIDYMVNPPLQVPVGYKENTRARLPGGLMYVDQNTPNGGIKSAYDVQLNMQHLLADIQDVRDRIRTGYYADLFMMLANDTRSGTTATEIAERHEEKLLMLGPVLERLHNELLSPMIDLAFDYASEAGILPPVPPELEGVDLNIEFVSTLAQAQRAVSAQGMDRLLSTVGSIAGMNPGVIDKIDFDQTIDDYADLYGVNPEIIVPDDVVAQRRAEKAKAQQAQLAAASMPAAAETLKTAGEVNTQGVQDVMQQFQGYTTGAPR